MADKTPAIVNGPEVGGLQSVDRVNVGDGPIINVKYATLNGVIDKGNISTSVTVDFADAKFQELTLTGDAALTLTAPGVMTGVVLRIKQDVTGGREPTFAGTNVYLMNSGAALAWSPDNTTFDVLSGITDGTIFMLAFGKQFAQAV